MAKTADSINMSSSSSSRRRTLFATAGAVMLGGGITSGIAATVADYAVPTIDPYAALLSMRAELLARSPTSLSRR